MKDTENLKEFLEKEFYTSSEVSEYNRNKESIGDVDVEFNIGSQHFKCNERFTTVSKKHPHPSNFQYIELYKRINNNEYYGWFLDPNKKSDSYLFFWTDDVRSFIYKNTNNILKGEYILITRASIIECLLVNGIGENVIYSLINDLKNDLKEISQIKNIKVVHSKKENYESIGLLINREELRNFSTYRKIFIK